MLLFIALTSFATIALGLVAVAQRPPHPVRQRARALGVEPGAAVATVDQPFTVRVIEPFARMLLKLLPHEWLRRIDHALVAAGDRMELGVFVVLWVGAAVVCTVVGLLLAPLWALLFGVIGVFEPLLFLRRKVHQRRKQITNALPDAIDLLVTCVEAGLGLDAALLRVAGGTEGPLGVEFNRTLREVAVGRPRQEALLDMGVRTGARDLDGVIRQIVQAERSGVSIGTTLRVEAEALRVRRRQRAEEAARRIGPKMIIVIGIFFIPAVMLIAVAPAVFNLIEFFSGNWAGG